MKKIFSISLLLVASLIACDKENKIPIESKIYFLGITKTDPMGNLMSDPDTTDWRFDDKWVVKEDDLFSAKYSSTNQKCTTSIFFYPNPVKDVFCISLLRNPSKSRLAVRLVNKDFKVIFKNDSIYSYATIKPSTINDYDTLRLYYKLIDSLNFEYKGHGDILIDK